MKLNRKNLADLCQHIESKEGKRGLQIWEIALLVMSLFCGVLAYWMLGSILETFERSTWEIVVGAVLMEAIASWLTFYLIFRDMVMHKHQACERRPTEKRRVAVATSGTSDQPVLALLR